MTWAAHSDSGRPTCATPGGARATTWPRLASHRASRCLPCGAPEQSCWRWGKPRPRPAARHSNIDVAHVPSAWCPTSSSNITIRTRHAATAAPGPLPQDRQPRPRTRAHVDRASDVPVPGRLRRAGRCVHALRGTALRSPLRRPSAPQTTPTRASTRAFPAARMAAILRQRVRARHRAVVGNLNPKLEIAEKLVSALGLCHGHGPDE